MITQIVLKDYHAIDHLTISDLKTCNIFCGKNNSGKTTTLECIRNSSKSRNLYVQISPHNIVKILKLIAGPNTTLKSTFKPNFVQAYLEKASGFILSEGSVNELVRIASEAWKQAFLNTGGFHVQKFTNGINTFLQNYPLVYLSSQRNPQLSDDKSYAVFPNENGKDFIAYLSRLKNSQVPSKDLRLWLKLKETFNFISGGCDFDVTVADNSQWTLQYTSPGDVNDWYRAYESGRGLSFVLFALCFILSPNYTALLIDEPEMHMHPEMQKRLYQVMVESGKQFFLSTHANTFIDPSENSKIFMLSNNGNIEATPITRKAVALSDLGYSITDNLVCDLIVLVEGSHDKPVIEWLLERMLGKEYSVKVWPLGGNNMEHVDLEVFTESCEVVAVIDKDPGSEKSRSRFKANCKKSGITCYHLERYAAENYLTLSALREVFGSEIPGKLASIPHDKKMKEILGFRVKNRMQEILSHMTLSDIEDTDLHDVAEEISSRIQGLSNVDG